MESPRHRTDAATETTTKQHRSAAEDEFLLSEYHVTMGPFKDYAQLVVIYGFGILFVAAYPLGPFLAALYCFVQIRVGGWRLCLRTRRAWPAGAEDIGTWSAIVDLMSYLAVIVNGLLLTYTGQFVVNNPWWMRALIFVLFGPRARQAPALRRARARPTPRAATRPSSTTTGRSSLIALS